MRAYDHALQPFLTDVKMPSCVGMPVTLRIYPDALLGPNALRQGDKMCASSLLDDFVCILQTTIIEERVEEADLLEAFRFKNSIMYRNRE